ncbi:MAG: molybdopterin-dependent oxidoreductase [Fastidiosipila sp.]|jgi:CO/xanthine dehydrogenase Mo-binding subunit|nr:molybdopterin-dependent oxidoreductase [Fastidiosipila sp.]
MDSEHSSQLTTYTSGNDSKIGQSFPIRDAVLKVKGELQYVGDMTVARMLHAKVLFSPKPHARIVDIDTSEAEKLPGVRAVVTHKNTPAVRFNPCGEDINIFHDQRVFDDKVRYVGDRVAAVAADSEKIAEQAVRLIKVTYEDLPFYTDPRQASEPEAVAIHPDGNLLQEVIMQAGNPDKAFAEADYVFTNTYHVPPIHHGAIEPHAALAVPDARGKVTVYTPTQDVFGVRKNLCRIFNLPMSRVRVASPAMGGGFGGKIDAVLEPVVMALAIATGRPVRLVFKRSEMIPSTRTRHEMYLTATTGVNKDGMIVGHELDLISNAGAYAAGAMSVVWALGGKVFKNYCTPHIRFRALPVYTNSPVGGAMRGYGSPQRCFAQQRQMNTIAKKLGISVIDLQLKNLVTPSSVDARDGQSHGEARPTDCVTMGAETFDWKARWEKQEADRRNKHETVRRGIGMAVAVHGNGLFGIMPDTNGVILKMNEDGTVHMLTGASDMGNGVVSVQAQFVAEILGLSLDEIEAIQADTDVTLWDLGDYSSRGTFVCGQAAIKAAEAVKEEVLLYASEMLELDVQQLILKESSVVSREDEGQRVTLAQVAQYAHDHHETDICHAKTFASNALALSYAAHFCEVEVDTRTGHCRVIDYLAVHDLGREINPMGLEGQIEGAIQMGLGYALSETLDVDPQTGRSRNSTLRKYRMPTATQMPPIRILTVGQPEESGPFGAKSVGECSTVPVAPAIANAISNALDCEFDELPIHPETVLRKIGGKNDIT